MMRARTSTTKYSAGVSKKRPGKKFDILRVPLVDASSVREFFAVSTIILHLRQRNAGAVVDRVLELAYLGVGCALFIALVNDQRSR